MIDLSLAGFLVFILAVGLLIYKDRKNMKLEGIVLMRRTNKGRAILDIVKKQPRLWKIIGIISLIAGIIGMIFITFFIANNTMLIFSGEKTGSVKIVLPWSEAGTAPGVFFLPWYFWIIGIAVIVIPHEFFHGFMCRLHGIKVKALGWFLLLGILPGAFVEPEKKSLDSAKPGTKLKIYAAGSFANILTAGIAYIITIILIFTFFAPAGVSVGVIANETYPAYQANMSGYITHINIQQAGYNTNTSGIEVRSVNDITSAMETVKIGDIVKITTNKGEYDIKTIEHPDNPGKAFIGITGPYNTVNEPKEQGTKDIVNFFTDMFMWIFILSLGIGLFNLLPMKPLDGGYIMEEIVKKPFPTHAKNAMIIISVAVFAMIVISLIGPIVL
ncbi:MAG: site-2 protease family protein [Candidatus Aenigmarchaeota archaeon]|nr:site-2 protease family protein [Candidatus Aenigmarchaeota archaeon]